jgi:hypothetical protein
MGQSSSFVPKNMFEFEKKIWDFFGTCPMGQIPKTLGQSSSFRQRLGTKLKNVRNLGQSSRNVGNSSTRGVVQGLLGCSNSVHVQDFLFEQFLNTSLTTL